ncbi:MAG: ABC transporter substrate-binding protein [Thiotrichales bacterium]|nr:ABC transporter substrate-binding protein [Thiotrichales bacterium]
MSNFKLRLRAHFLVLLQTVLSVFLATQSPQVFAINERTDCALSDIPQRVYGANPVVSYLLVAMAPEKMVGWNFPPPAQAKGIFPDRVFELPVLGGWFGQGQTPNFEQLIATKPELVILSGATVHTDRQVMIQKMGMPVCHLQLDQLSDYPHALRSLGQWLGKTERGERLAQHFEQLLSQQSALLDLLKTRNIPLKTVYYAQDPNGLASECRGSIHAETLPWAGAINPHQCPAEQAKQSRFGKVSINLEQLLSYNPDAIVTQEKAFYDQVYHLSAWRGLKAVQNQQVFFAPQIPFRWLDRPPSFLRLLAAQWLMQKLYPQVPEIAALDTVAQTQRFFADFFSIDLSAAQAHHLLKGLSS